MAAPTTSLPETLSGSRNWDYRFCWLRDAIGIWESRGAARHFTFSKVMAWVAFDRGIKLAETLNLDGPVERWRSIAAESGKRSGAAERGVGRSGGRRAFALTTGAAVIAGGAGNGVFTAATGTLTAPDQVSGGGCISDEPSEGKHPLHIRPYGIRDFRIEGQPLIALRNSVPYV